MGKPLREGRWFAWSLAAIAAAGLVIRIIYVVYERRDVVFGGDAHFYHEGANLFAHGKGLISPFFYERGRVVEAADHPPLYLLFLAIPSLLGMTSTLSHLLWSCALGTATIVVTGLLGREVGGERVGILAATIAAVYPNVWAPDGSLQAESLAMLTTALALLFAYRYWKRPSWGRIAALGAACGAAALARSELILLLPLLVVPLALLTRRTSGHQRVRWLGVSVLGTLVVIAPWVGFNLSRFRHPVLLSSQFEYTLATANCDFAYYGRYVGYWSFGCAKEVADREFTPDLDQSQQAIIYRRAAFEYIGDHSGRLPAVVAARLGRILGVFRPSDQIIIDHFPEGRELGVARAGLYSFYAVALLAIAGTVILRRRRAVPLFPLLAAPAVALITVAVTYSSTRFRASAEIALAVLAAVAISATLTAVAARHRDRHARTAAPIRRDNDSSPANRDALIGTDRSGC